MLHLLKTLHRDTRAATALEYGLILCLIVVVMAAGLTALGRANGSLWNSISNQSAAGIAQASS